MKIKKLVFLCIAALCMTMLVASLADGGIAARLEGNVLVVTWSGAGSGSCALEVCQNGWPVLMRTVSGGDGRAVVDIGAPSGKYTVRLKTANGCMSCDVVSGSAQVPTPAAKPTPAPTLKPMPTAAPNPVNTAGVGTIRGDLADEVVRQVNAERAKYGLSSLRVDAELVRAAEVRAREIVQSFSHTRPDGRAWSTVSASAYGENIARGQKTADKVMAAWLTSEGHRANILRPSYGSIGVCAINFDGIIYWVQLFGKQAPGA